MHHFASRSHGPATLLLVLWLIPLAVLFAPVLPADRCFAFRDAAHYYPPLLQTVVSQWSSQLPLWNPLEERGRPLWGDPTATVLYPGLCLFALPISFSTAYKLYILVHIWMCGVTSWIAARRLGTSIPGAAISGVSYALGGSVLFQYCNPPYLIGAAWLPLGLSSILAVVNGGRSRWPSLELTFVLTLLVLAGDLQTAYLLGIISLLSVVVLVVRSSEPSTQTLWRLRLTAVGRLAAAGALAVGLSAAQWLPTLHWAQRSERASVTSAVDQLLADATVRLATENESHAQTRYRFSIGPWRWFELVWPNLSGRMFPQNERWIRAIPAESETWAPSLYLGLVPLLLAMSGWRLVGGQAIDRWLSGLVLFGALGSLGRFGIGWIVNEVTSETQFEIVRLQDPVGGLYWGLSQLLPGFSFFRYPAKLWIWTALALSLLAGRQLDSLREPPARRRATIGLLYVILLATISALLLTVANGSSIERWWSTAPVDLPFGPLQADAARLQLIASLIHSTVVGGLSVWLLHRFATPGWWLVLLTAADLTLASRWMIATVSCAPTPAVAPSIAELHEPADNAEPVLIFRLAARGWYPHDWQTTGSDQRLEECLRWDLWTARPKHPLRAGLAALNSETSFSSRAQRQLLTRLDELNRKSPADFVKLVSRLGVDYVCGPNSLHLPGLVPLDPPSPNLMVPFKNLHDFVDARWWRVPDSWPYAWITHEPRLLDRLDKVGPLPLPTSESHERCNVQQVTGGQVVVDVQVERDGWLVMNEMYAPGWEADIQTGDMAMATEVVPAYDYQRAVSLPAGNHRVTLVYRPASVRWGIAASAVSATVLCVLAWRAGRRPSTL